MLSSLNSILIISNDVEHNQTIVIEAYSST